jgi:hypothetical protein
MPWDASSLTVWRIKINSGRGDVDWDGARAYCRSRGVVGLGWGDLLTLPGTATLNAVLAAVEAVPEWNPTGPRMIRRFALEAVDGDLVWTRDRRGGYWLGRIAGSWRFDSSEEAQAWDLGNVRPCNWLPEAFRDYEVPGAVVRNFAGTGETLRRIRNPAAIRITEMLWTRATNPDTPQPPIPVEEVITDLLDPIDVEDIVLLLLQADGWLLLPSSRMHDTPMYEATLRNRKGRLGVVSVKSGASSPVPIPELAEAAGEAQPFAYSTHDAYTAPPSEHGVIAIEREQLMTFMAERPELLPPRISQWLAPEAP